jgi:magnesium transporter
MSWCLVGSEMCIRDSFESMPEIHWKYGYVFAIAFMISSSLGTLYFFRRKRWL